jgi:hypothetical protein
MTTNARGARRTEAGAAAVEFGLVALLLFTLLFGIIQFGFWFWSWQAAGHAAREAARVAAVAPCDSGRIKTAGAGPLESVPGGDSAAVDVSRTTVKVGEEITVRVRFTTLNLGFFPGFDGAVDKSATSRIENVPAGGC